MASHSVRRIVHTLAELGPRAFLASAWRRLTDGRSVTTSNAPWTGKTAGVIHPFDAECSTETGGIISGEKLSTGSRSDTWNTAYFGISPSVLNQALAALELDFSRFTFIDLGSGKGRALLLASRFPWRAILGVELAPELNQIATNNIRSFSASWQVCYNLEARTGDAATFEHPPGPLVLFLYHPFLAPVLKRWLKNLAESLAADPRDAYIVYVNPILGGLIQRIPKIVMLWERSFPYSEEDAAADQLGGTADRVAVWHYHP